MTNVISLVAYARAVAILGPSRASPFAALIPAVTALLGILVLGEHPASADWAGIRMRERGRVSGIGRAPAMGCENCT